VAVDKVADMFRKWVEGTLQSVLASVIIALIPGAAVTYLAHIQSAWTTPVLLGLGASALTMFIVLSVDAIRRLPPRRVIPNLKNIERCVRDWLDDFQFAVKNSPLPTAYFRYLVTADSGTKMFVGRTKNDFDDYLQVRAEISATQNDLELIGTLSQNQQALLILGTQLELARRHVGYANLALPANDFYIFKRIPIRETLTEHEFVAALEEMEAAVHSVGILFGISLTHAGHIPPSVGSLTQK
jgi:hypothetical protein